MIILGVVNSISWIFVIASQFKGPFDGLDIIDTLINVSTFVVSVVYIYKLFKMRGNLLKWTNYAFGLDALSVIFPIIIIPMAWPLYMMVLLLEIVVWFFFYKHLKKLSIGSVK